MKPFLQMKLPPQSRRKGHAALTSCYIGLQKTKKVTFFINWLLCGQDGKGYPFFYQFCCHSKRLARFHATMFQNIQQFHSGGSNTPVTYPYHRIDMRILCIELSQLKRIAISNASSNCVCKGCPYQCYILKFNTLANRFE